MIKIKTLTLCRSNVIIFTSQLSFTVKVSCKCIEIGRKCFIRRKAWMVNPTDYNISIVNLYQTVKNMTYKEKDRIKKLNTLYNLTNKEVIF